MIAVAFAVLHSLPLSPHCTALAVREMYCESLRSTRVQRGGSGPLLSGRRRGEVLEVICRSQIGHLVLSIELQSESRQTAFQNAIVSASSVAEARTRIRSEWLLFSLT